MTEAKSTPSRGPVGGKEPRSPHARAFRCAVVLVLTLCPQAARAEDGVFGPLQQRAAQEALLGSWVAQVGETQVRLELAADGSCQLGGVSGTYEADADSIVFRTEAGAAEYTYSVGSEGLSLSGGDIVGSLTFVRPAAPAPPIASPVTPKAGVIGEQQTEVLSRTLRGRWVAQVGKAQLDLRLHDEGKFTLNDSSGTYTVSGGALVLTSDGAQMSYQFDISPQDVLTISGGDLAQPVKLSRSAEIGGFVKSTLSFSAAGAKRKAVRIAVILLIVLVTKLAFFLLWRISHFVIYSEWGPLRYLYQRQKSRVKTIHSIALNLAKYVVYFTAIGFILTELGVNYTVYLASLSVIGLAIGFGSQGLVQDIVTGFFIIFEAQFDVGDMVDISGQVGTVEELGLRMTRLRSYFGQTVVIPNRNVAVVANYLRAGLPVHLDVAVGAEEGVETKVSGLLKSFCPEMQRQFADIILSGPKVVGPISLKTGERFVRLHLSIWPQQQWLVDQQLIPRIRELLKRENVEIPGDRVVAFYHVPQPKPLRRQRKPATASGTAQSGQGKSSTP